MLFRSVILIAGLSYYFYRIWEEARPEDIIKEKQKKQLKVLRGQAEPMSKEEMERQKEELDKLRISQ